MKRLLDVLPPVDRGELDRALPSGAAQNPESARIAASVRGAVDAALRIEDDAAEQFGAQEPMRRARMISEMVWRITCIYDSSSTAVEGLVRFNLGYGFQLAVDDEAGRPLFTVRLQG